MYFLILILILWPGPRHTEAARSAPDSPIIKLLGCAVTFAVGVFDLLALKLDYYYYYYYYYYVEEQKAENV